MIKGSIVDEKILKQIEKIRLDFVYLTETILQKT